MENALAIMRNGIRKLPMKINCVHAKLTEMVEIAIVLYMLKRINTF